MAMEDYTKVEKIGEGWCSASFTRVHGFVVGRIELKPVLHLLQAHRV